MHKYLELSLINNNKEPIQFRTVTYTFAIDDYLSKYNGVEDINISIDDVREDFKVLLQDNEGNPFNEKYHNIDLKKQDYDLILQVYAFFLQYKKNAYIRQLQYNNEQLNLEIERAKQILEKIPELINQIISKQTTWYGLLQKMFIITIILKETNAYVLSWNYGKWN